MWSADNCCTLPAIKYVESMMNQDSRQATLAKPKSADTLAIESLRPGESYEVPISEAINVRAKISKLKKKGVGDWITRLDKPANVCRIVRL